MSAGFSPRVSSDGERGSWRPGDAPFDAVVVVSWDHPSGLLDVLRDRPRLASHVVSRGAAFVEPPEAAVYLVDGREREPLALAWVGMLMGTRPGAMVVACVSTHADALHRDPRIWVESGCVGMLSAADADPALPEILRGWIQRLGALGAGSSRLVALRGAFETMRDGRFRVSSPEQVACLGAWLEEPPFVEGPDPSGVVELLRGTLELRSRGREVGRAVDLCFHRSGKQLDVSIASDPAFSSGARAGWSLEEARLFQGEVLAPWEREQILQACDRVLEESGLDDPSGWLDVARFLAGELGSETVVIGHLDRRGRWALVGAVGAGDLATAGDAQGPRGADLAEVFAPVTREGRPFLCNRPVGRPSFQRAWRRVAAVPLLRGGKAIGTLHVANRSHDYTDRDLARMFLISRRLSPFLSLAWDLKSEREHRAHSDRLLAACGRLAFELDETGQVVYQGTPEGQEPVVGTRFVSDVPALAPLGLSLIEAANRVRSSGHAILWEGTTPTGSAFVRLAPLPHGHVGAFLDLAAHPRELESQAQRFFELSLDMLATLDVEQLVSVNEAFAEGVGWNDAELIGRAVSDVIYPDDRAGFQSLLRGLAEGRSRASYGQARILTKAGLVRIVDWSATRYQGATYLVGRDVTDERRAMERLATQHAELTRQHRDTVEDHAIARRVLAGVIREGCLDAPFINYSLSPLAVFNGDVALAAELPDGSLRWFLGDFAGHGLSGAIGTIPLASTFHATARKGVSLAETLVTLNDSLRSILPPWLFCAGALLELDRDGRRLSVWNAGLPGAIVRRLDGSLVRLGSRHAPLGILEPHEFATSVEEIEVSAGERIVVFSDGLVAAKRRDAREWGITAIEALLSAAPPDAPLMELLLHGVEAFREGTPRSDDTSLVEVVVGPGPRLRSPNG